VKIPHLLVAMVAVVLTGCPKPTPGGGNTSNIDDGTYQICDKKIEAHKVPGQPDQNFAEDHLGGATRVKIETIDGDRVVSFLRPQEGPGSLSFGLAVVPDETHGLRTVGSFLHKTPENTDDNLLHRVVIHKLERDAGNTLPGSCGGRTVLEINFCYLTTDDAGKSRFQCMRDVQHGGDIHVQEN
jgi:hypothetical protein